MASVLLVAPGVDGHDIGEAWVAYQWASRISNHHSVTLLTYRKRGRSSAVEQLPGVRVIEWDELAFVGKTERFNSLFKPWYPHYYFLCRKWIRMALGRGERFDVAHQTVPVAMRYPSPLAGIGVPYILGPVGGSLSSPAGFAEVEAGPWYMDMRKVDALRLRRDLMLRRSYSQAAVVLGIAPYVRDLLVDVPIRRFEVMSETAVASVPATVDRRNRSGPLRLLFVGRLIRTKGARDIVRAMADIRDLDVVIDIVGEGFDRSACEQLAKELHLTDRVLFHGAVERKEVDGFYQAADVFVFPSYREPGGNVPFEAMSYGLPMIVCDRGGPGYVVNEQCGIRIPASDPVTFAAAIGSAIRELAGNADRRIRMGESARRQVGALGTWDSRLAQINAIYHDVCGRGSPDGGASTK